MNIDPELKAMNEVYLALKDLEDESKQRVIDWVVGRLSLSSTSSKELRPPEDVGKHGKTEKKDFGSFESVADVFANANVKSDRDKVLVIASYLQDKKGEELTGREINKELNHLGHGVGNITNAITSLMNRKPQLMIQTRKEGKTKQAQKKYKVTTEGFAAAIRMVIN